MLSPDRSFFLYNAVLTVPLSSNPAITCTVAVDDRIEDGRDAYYNDNAVQCMIARVQAGSLANAVDGKQTTVIIEAEVITTRQVPSSRL